MKTMLLSAVLICSAVFANAQDIAPSAVPSVVLNTFQQKYPKASGTEWEMQAELYNAEFEIGFTDHEAWFDSTGKLVKHTNEISYSDLPAVVKSSLKQSFAGYRFTDADKIDFQGAFTYRIEIEKGQEERIVLLDADGKVLDNQVDY